MLQRYIPIPEELQGEVDPQDFYNCLECFEESIDRENFDAVGFANELEASIVAPLRHAQELFDTTPYLTRLFTTLSAEEMTRDPVFAYNGDMGDVDNVRRATVIERPRRDRAAARRALARLRAAYGPEAVSAARLRDAHLPEARYRWEPAGDVNPSRPSAVPRTPRSG